MKFQTLCLIAAACLAACNNVGNSGQISAKERKEIETEIASRIDDLRTAWANLDAPAVAAFFSEHGRDTYNGDRGSFTELMDWAATGYAGITSTDIAGFRCIRLITCGLLLVSSRRFS